MHIHVSDGYFGVAPHVSLLPINKRLSNEKVPSTSISWVICFTLDKGT